MFTPSQPGPREVYVGSITKFGLDIGATAGGEMVWAVFAPSNTQVRRAGRSLRRRHAPKRRSAPVSAPTSWSAARTAPSSCSRCRCRARPVSTSRPASPELICARRGKFRSVVKVAAALARGRPFFMRAVSAEGKGVVIGALHLAAGHRAAARHMHHVADHRAGRAMQAVARDRHRRERFPGVGLRDRRPRWCRTPCRSLRRRTPRSCR